MEVSSLDHLVHAMVHNEDMKPYGNATLNTLINFKALVFNQICFF